MKSLQVLVRRVGDLPARSRPAASPTSSARCRGALAARGRRASRTLVPGYPAVLDGASPTAEAVHTFADLFGGPARLLAGRSRRARPAGARRAASLSTGRATPMSGRTARLARQRVPLRRARPGPAPRSGSARMPTTSRPTSCTRMTGRRRSRRPICAMPATAASGDGHHRPQSRLPGPVPAELLAPLRLPPRAFAHRRRRVLRRIGFLKAGLQLADRITTVSPTYAARDPDAGSRHGPRRPAARARRSASTASSTASTTSVWNPATDPHLPRAYDHWQPGARARPTRRRCRNGFGLERRSGRAALRRRQPALLAEGASTCCSTRCPR